MDNLQELNIKFGRETIWYKSETCKWCPRIRKGRTINKLNYTQLQYLQRGNICQECSSVITNNHMNNIKEEMEQRYQEKKKELDRLGEILDKDISEEVRAKIVDKMMSLHSQIKSHEKNMSVLQEA